MKKILSKVVNHSLGMLGFELKRKNFKSNKKRDISPPIIFDDMKEALHYTRGGTPASFSCPLDHFIHRTGLSFSTKGWHPYVETLREYEQNSNLKYENSTLKKYYEKWQPRTAAQAFIGFKNTPKQFHHLPPHLIYLTPWNSLSVEQIDHLVRKWHEEDNIEHANAALPIEEHGFSDFGPVSDVKGKLEFMRIISVYNTLKKEDYDRKHGDISVLVLKTNTKYRYINKGDGYHRSIAMVALGHDKVPVKFFNPWIICLDDIDYWPQVRKKVWSRDEAEGYFNYLFNFDSRLWAKNKGLLKGSQL